MHSLTVIAIYCITYTELLRNTTNLCFLSSALFQSCFQATVTISLPPADKCFCKMASATADCDVYGRNVWAIYQYTLLRYYQTASEMADTINHSVIYTKRIQ